MTGEASASPWADALLAARLFTLDPACGLAVHAAAGPVRDTWLRLLPRTSIRVAPSIGDAALLGGLDLAATLAAGRPVASAGVLARAEGGTLLLAMAERLPAGTAARIAGALDAGRIGAVALDESAGDEEALPAALADRLALHIDLDGIGVREAVAPAMGAPTEAQAPAGVAVPDDVAETLCGAALALGIVSLRPSLQAVRVARVHAALHGRARATPEDAAAAARLVLAPRATMLPAAPAEQSPAPPDPARGNAAPPPETSEASDRRSTSSAPAELVLQAAVAAIPAGLLARLAASTARGRAGPAGKRGALRTAARGRPAGLRARPPGPGERLQLVETLRAAAPWQRLRGASPSGDGRLAIRRDDFRVQVLKQRARTTTIFVVDASGSQAFARLAEAKGAVELLLADCYRRRDQVAVLAFRGSEASMLLAPTRSLVRAKRSLAALPGGGGTPLAAGVVAATALAATVQRGGATPALVFLTDGRGNIALDGTASRARATEDAQAAARRLAATGIRAVLVDTATRPQPAARALAADMGALYLALPHAGPRTLASRLRAP